MPQKTWSAKRERQYEHINESLIDRGKKEAVAEEIAARTVNKERAQHGESVEASASSINDMPAGRRGGLFALAGAAATGAGAPSRCRCTRQPRHRSQHKTPAPNPA